VDLVRREGELLRREQQLRTERERMDTEQAKYRREYEEDMRRLDAKSLNFSHLKRQEEELVKEVREMQGRKEALERQLVLASKKQSSLTQQGRGGVSNTSPSSMPNSPGAGHPRGTRVGSAPESPDRVGGVRAGSARFAADEFPGRALTGEAAAVVSSEHSEALERARVSLDNALSQAQRLRDEKTGMQEEIRTLKAEVEAVLLQSRSEERRRSRGSRGSITMINTQSPAPFMLDGPSKPDGSPNSVCSGRWGRGESSMSELQRWMVDALSSSDWGWGCSPNNHYDGEVVMFLRHLGLQHYAHSLTTEEVYTLSVLSEMDEDSLEKLGIRTKASRLRILDGAKCLKNAIELARSPEAPVRSHSRSMEGSPANRRGSMRTPSLGDRTTSNGHFF